MHTFKNAVVSTFMLACMVYAVVVIGVNLRDNVNQHRIGGEMEYPEEHEDVDRNAFISNPTFVLLREGGYRTGNEEEDFLFEDGYLSYDSVEASGGGCW